MPDDDNDALFANANIGFGGEAHPEGTAVDAAAVDAAATTPTKEKERALPLSCT
jgi:hypothetical protein